jgi:hypothetical protein
MNQILYAMNTITEYKKDYNDDFFIEESIKKFNRIYEELNKSEKLCIVLSKLNIETIKNTNASGNKLTMINLEENKQLIEKCKELNNSITLLQPHNNNNINNIINNKKNNNNDNNKIKKNNNEKNKTVLHHYNNNNNSNNNNNNDNNNIDTNVDDLENDNYSNKEVNVSNDEIIFFVNSNDMNETVQVKQYSCNNNKSLELYFINLVHKSFVSLEKNRNDLIHFIYYYVNYHISDNNFLTDTIDVLGWSEGLNILGERLNDLMEKTYNAHLLSLIPPEFTKDVSIKPLNQRGAKVDLYKTISKYNQSLDAAQLKIEAHGFKAKHWYTVWFTLNRIHDSLCWFYLKNYMDAKEKLKIPEINKFLEIFQDNSYVVDTKVNKCFEYSIQELFIEGKIENSCSNNAKDNYFKKIFNRDKDVNNRMLLSTAIKIVKLKYLETNRFCRTKLEDYSKSFKSHYVSYIR